MGLSSRRLGTLRIIMAVFGWCIAHVQCCIVRHPPRTALSVLCNWVRHGNAADELLHANFVVLANLRQLAKLWLAATIL